MGDTVSFSNVLYTKWVRISTVDNVDIGIFRLVLGMDRTVDTAHLD